MNATERFHVERVASLRCCVGKRFGGCEGRENVHHVAEGSGKRSWFAIAKLCEAHHVGPLGLHSGTKAFIRRFRPPGDSEFGMLVWTNEDIAKFDLARSISKQVRDAKL
jgi:hypothetical protein